MLTNLTNSQIQDLVVESNKYLKKLGLFLKPFVLSQYNDAVSKEYQLSIGKAPLHKNTVCLIVASNAKFCGKIMQKFSENIPSDLEREFIENPVHCITKYYLKHFVIAKLYEKFGSDIEILHDFDMINNRPRILVQTAGHVSGMAYFYHPEKFRFSDLKYGCSLHPIYGGWFGFRGAIILKNYYCDSFNSVEPVDVFGGLHDDVRYFLELFNAFDSKWRDVVPSLLRYDQEQIDFFNTPPSQRSLPLKLNSHKITVNKVNHLRELSSSSFAEKDLLLHEATDLHDEPDRIEELNPKKYPELSIKTQIDKNDIDYARTPATLRSFIDSFDGTIEKSD